MVSYIIVMVWSSKPRMKSLGDCYGHETTGSGLILGPEKLRRPIVRGLFCIWPPGT